MVSSGVDQQHTKQHYVASNTTCFCVVNLKRNLRSDLDTLDVEETALVSIISEASGHQNSLDIMSTSMQDSEEDHSISDLTMEPH